MLLSLTVGYSIYFSLILQCVLAAIVISAVIGLVRLPSFQILCGACWLRLHFCIVLKYLLHFFNVLQHLFLFSCLLCLRVICYDHSKLLLVQLLSIFFMVILPSIESLWKVALHTVILDTHEFVTLKMCSSYLIGNLSRVRVWTSDACRLDKPYQLSSTVYISTNILILIFLFIY